MRAHRKGLSGSIAGAHAHVRTGARRARAHARARTGARRMSRLAQAVTTVALAATAVALALIAPGAQAALDYTFSSSFGRGLLTNPYGLGVDQSNGAVYVADSVSDRVYKFNSSGTLLTGFGAKGSIDGSATPAGAFGPSVGVAVDNSSGPSRHDFYAADPTHNAVDKFSATGTYLCQITGAGNASTSLSECDRTDATPPGSRPLSFPAALAVDAAGNVYIIDTTRSTANVFTSSGRYARFFPVQPAEDDGDPSGPSGTSAVDAAGNLYTVTPTEPNLGGGVHVYTPAGEANTTIGCPLIQETGCPRVYTAEFLKEEKLVEELRGPGALRGPLGLPFSGAIDPASGNVFIGDNNGEHSGPAIFGPGLIDLYDSAGHPLNQFGFDVTPRMGTVIQGIGAYGAGRLLYAADSERGIVDVFGPAFNGPAVLSEAASDVTGTTATLHGSVNPEGHPVTLPDNCRFQYLSNFDFHANGDSFTGRHHGAASRPCTTAPGAGSSAVPEALNLTGLQPGTTYRFRIVASNDGSHFAVGADTQVTTGTQTTHPYIRPFGSFRVLTDVAVDNSSKATAGDVYAVDVENRVVERFSADGTTPANFAALGSNTLDGSNITGTPPGSFQRPAMVAVDPANGNFYVTDNEAHVVDRFAPDGSYLSQLTPKSSATPNGPFTPFGVAVDPRNGDVYVSDSNGDPRISNQAVDRFNRAGKYLLSFSVPFLHKFGETDDVEVSPKGDVYVENRFDSVQKFDARGNAVAIDGHPGDGNALDTNTPQSIAIDPSTGEIYIYENLERGIASASLVQRYSSGGRQIDQFGTNIIQGSAYGLAVNGSTHDFYAADINAGTVQLFGPAPGGCGGHKGCGP